MHHNGGEIDCHGISPRWLLQSRVCWGCLLIFQGEVADCSFAQKLLLLGIKELAADAACGTWPTVQPQNCPADVAGLSIHKPENTRKLITGQALIQGENVNPVVVF